MEIHFVSYLLLFFLIFSIGKSQGAAIEEDDGDDKRLVGGTKPKVGEVPYIVSMAYYLDPSKKFSKRICGGAILNEDWILTAAHCLENKTAEQIFFKAGVVSAVSGDKDSMQLIETEKIYKHPKFAYSHYHFWDIALIKTIDKIKFNNNVQPIHLPEHDSEPSEPNVLIMGYGAVDAKAKVEFGTLKTANTRFTPRDECHKLLFSFHDKLLCVSHKNVPQDSGICPGDSGSPVVQKRNGVNVVVGINSFLQGDCGLGVSAFTHVSKYVNNFIKPILDGKEPTV